MRGILVLILLLGLAVAGFGQSRWKKESIQLPQTICYASAESHVSYIGPPGEYFKHLKSASALQATILVTYSGFSPEAQQAFQYAVDIWKNLVYSPVPIRIKANWVSLNQGVLGSCGPSGYYKNFNSTQKWNCYYPVAVVEKMLGEDVNGPNQYELEANFNKDFANWYMGIDGKTPARQYDLVSVVLHELTHGLGFTGLLYSVGGKGGYSYGDDSLAGIFDQFIVTQNGEKLVNKTIFPDPSIKLNLALTSGWLDFTTNLYESKLMRLYAPTTWNSGSSIYHLDEASYPGGDPNSLMTPFTGTGEAIHNPGPGTLAMMYEIGWKTVSIKHEPLKDIEFASSPIDFNATIVSDYPLDSSKIFLVYSTNRWIRKDSVLLEKTAIPGNFTKQLSQFKSGEVDYYFSASDVNQRRFVYPSNAPSRYLYFKIGLDYVPPVVTHKPIQLMLSSSPSAMVEALVTDNLGVKSVKIEYYVNGGLLKSIPLTNTGKDIYSGNFVFPAGTVKGGDKISYRIAATDASSQGNVGRSPLSGYNTFTIETITTPIEKYVNNFNQVTNDFIGTDFNVSRPTGFDTPGLNSAHPYVSPDQDNMHLNFTSILRNPIILKEGGKMSFDEVVLVEPGEPGVTYESEDFYDYVIVEGSRDGGISWKPLINGYDSNAQTSWYKLFISSTSGNNSSAVATKDSYIKREIDLLANGNFKAGETILIRFRLFSDPYSNGWGWIIDNLNIQDVTTDAPSMVISSGEVQFYPNPATDQLTIQFQTKNNIGKFQIKAYNSLGKIVYNQAIVSGSNSYSTKVDVSSFNPGLYLFAIEPEKGEVVTRKILIQ